LNLSYINRFAQLIDSKAHLLYPKHRPLIGLIGKKPFCKNNILDRLGQLLFGAFFD